MNMKKIMYIESPCRKMTGALHGDFHQKILRSIILIKYLLTFHQDNDRSYLTNYRLL